MQLTRASIAAHNVAPFRGVAAHWDRIGDADPAQRAQENEKVAKLWSAAAIEQPPTAQPEGPASVATPTSTSASPLGEKRWSFLFVALLTGIVPALVARRSRHVSLANAYWAHLLAVIAATAFLFLLVCWSEALSPTNPSNLLYEIDNGITFLLSEIDSVPGWQVALTIGSTFLGIEIGALVLALVCSPWGAADEPIRSSIKHAVGRTWMHTPFLAILILLAGTIVVELDGRRSEAIFAVNREVPWETLPADITPGERQQTRQEWRRAHDEAWNQYPFLVRNAEVFMVLTILLAAIWWLWALFCGIGSDRHVSPIARPPICEQCGYNLTGIALEGRCPECGEPAEVSLGEDARPGSPWQRRRTVGWWPAWWRSVVDPITKPTRFGRQLRAVSAGTDHRRFFALHVPAIFLTAWVGCILCLAAESGISAVERETEIVWLVGPWIAFITSLFTMALSMISAFAVGLLYQPKAERNLTGVAMQATSYLSGLLVCCVAADFIWFALLIAHRPFYAGIEATLQVARTLIITCAVLAPNLIGFGFYLSRVLRITSGARYANR